MLLLSNEYVFFDFVIIFPSFEAIYSVCLRFQEKIWRSECNKKFYVSMILFQ